MSLAVCLGEALIDFVADTAGVPLLECPGFLKAPGGAPANVAVGLARLGVPAAFVGKVGEDPFGRFLQRTFADAAVDTSGMRFDPNHRTGLAFVALGADGERDFAFFRNPSADMLLRPEEIPDELLACRVFHFGSITLIQDPSRSATLDALARARRQGAWISYDPNLRPLLWPDLETARSEIRAALPLADFVKVSEEEAEFLYGPAPLPELAARLLGEGPSLVALTRGAAGAVLATAATQLSLPGFQVEVVDTTGAGDGFAAGLIAWLLKRGAGPAELTEVDLREAGRFACAVAALTCTRKGAIPALPSGADVRKLLGEG